MFILKNMSTSWQRGYFGQRVVSETCVVPESGFIHNTVPEDEYTKTELEDEILKPILKVLNYKIQNDRG